MFEVDPAPPKKLEPRGINLEPSFFAQQSRVDKYFKRWNLCKKLIAREGGAFFNEGSLSENELIRVFEVTIRDTQLRGRNLKQILLVFNDITMPVHTCLNAMQISC